MLTQTELHNGSLQYGELSGLTAAAERARQATGQAGGQPVLNANAVHTQGDEYFNCEDTSVDRQYTPEMTDDYDNHRSKDRTNLAEAVPVKYTGGRAARAGSTCIDGGLSYNYSEFSTHEANGTGGATGQNGPESGNGASKTAAATALVATAASIATAAAPAAVAANSAEVAQIGLASKRQKVQTVANDSPGDTTVYKRRRLRCTTNLIASSSSNQVGHCQPTDSVNLTMPRGTMQKINADGQGGNRVVPAGMGWAQP